MFNSSIWPIDTRRRSSVDCSIFSLFFLFFPFWTGINPNAIGYWLLLLLHTDRLLIYSTHYCPRFLVRNPFVIIIHLSMAFATILNQIRFLDLQFEIFQLNGIPLKKSKDTTNQPIGKLCENLNSTDVSAIQYCILCFFVVAIFDHIVSEPFTMFHLIPKSTNAMKFYFSVSRNWNDNDGWK